MENKLTVKELVHIAKEVLHSGFGTLPKNSQSVLTHYHLVEWLDGLVPTEDKKD